MSLFKCLLLAGLISQTLLAAHGEARCPGNAPSLTLRLVRGSQIIMPVQINHSGPYDFVVDTGAQTSTIEPSLAAELRLKPQGQTGVAGVATFARITYVYLDLVEAGAHSVSNSVAVIQEMNQLKAADSPIRGILGASFLEHFDLLIDYGRSLLCLDESGLLASAVKGEHIALAEPRGAQKDLPFTRPIIVSARLSGFAPTPVLLRLDSGSNAPVLYSVDPRVLEAFPVSSTLLKRVINGVEQTFAELPPQDIQIGKRWVRHVPFVIPKNSVGGGPITREDGLLPTIAFERVFISCSAGYVTLEPREQ